MPKASSFTVHDGLIDIFMEWTDIDLTRASNTIEFAAKYLWDTHAHLRPQQDGEDIPWDDLSNQQRLNIVLRKVTTEMIEWAGISWFKDQVQDAIDAASVAKDDAIMPE